MNTRAWLAPDNEVMMNEQEIRADERRRIAQEIREEAHATGRYLREAQSEGREVKPSDIGGVAPGSALRIADWIER